ncbi:MAG TPA: FAD-dependent oxidoreductase [Propionicimonas sp.]|jgi:hypothetical protein
MAELGCDVVVVGGGLGGVAAALAALRLGRRVILTEESPWLGGQLTSQAVPPDEHPWIERQGATGSYLELRRRIRAYYRRGYPLTRAADADPLLNPGGGQVSALTHEPRVAVAVIDEMLAPYRADAQLRVLLGHRPVAADTDGDRVCAVTLRGTGGDVTVTAPYVIDATELGDLLELADVEHVTGAESRHDSGELHAVDGAAQPLDQQAFTWCFAMDYRHGGDFTIDRPADYEAWRDLVPADWPGPLFSFEDVVPSTLAARHKPLFAGPQAPDGVNGDDWWNYRAIFTPAHYPSGRYASGVTLVNWPQVDYMAGPLVGVDPIARDRHLAAARAQSLAFLYWMQTAAPRHDGGTGYPGLRPRGDLLGSDDHLALRPYVRESRRILAEFTVLEQHVGVDARRAEGLPAGAATFRDSIGVGSYRIDLHPSSGGDTGWRTYVDVSTYPFQIPLGALLPQRVGNLLPGAKNIGTTHVTNGCYRLHPVEWTIGEAAGALAAHCLANGTQPLQVRADDRHLTDFQRLLTERLAFQLRWPEGVRTTVC